MLNTLLIVYLVSFVVSWAVLYVAWKNIYCPRYTVTEASILACTPVLNTVFAVCCSAAFALDFVTYLLTKGKYDA